LTNSSGSAFSIHNLTGGPFNVSFTLAINLSDSQNILWGIEVSMNSSENNSNLQNVTFSVNRTLRVEFPPTIELHTPATGNISNTKFVNLNYSVNSTFIDGSLLNANLYDCQLWDNSSGTWLQTAGFTGINSSIDQNSVPRPHAFSEVEDIIWNIRCAERNEPRVYAWAPVNLTLSVDSTPPTVTLNSPVNFSFHKDPNSLVFSYTPTDLNLNACTLSNNLSGVWIGNVTNTSFPAGSGAAVLVDINISDLANGDYLWNVNCTDTAGFNAWGVINYTVTYDNVTPFISDIVNYTLSNTCNSVGIGWITDEPSIGNISYGIPSPASTATLATGDNVSLRTQHNVTLEFGDNRETLYNFSVDICDAAGNCVGNFSQNVTTPLPLCNVGGSNAGWSAYTILDEITTLGSLANESRATFAYWWNNSDQSWLFNQINTGSNAGVYLPYGSAVFLFSESNLTWFRNANVTEPLYNFNLSVGDNFVGITSDYTMHSLSQSFLNTSGGEIVDLNNSDNPVFVNLSLVNNTPAFASFNNSANNYDSYYRNFSTGSTTPVSRGDVIWTWVNSMNMTWNGTAIKVNTSISLGI